MEGMTQNYYQYMDPEGVNASPHDQSHMEIGHLGLAQMPARFRRMCKMVSQVSAECQGNHTDYAGRPCPQMDRLSLLLAILVVPHTATT